MSPPFSEFLSLSPTFSGLLWLNNNTLKVNPDNNTLKANPNDNTLTISLPISLPISL